MNVGDEKVNPHCSLATAVMVCKNSVLKSNFFMPHNLSLLIAGGIYSVAF
jgi:hypothetical protein